MRNQERRTRWEGLELVVEGDSDTEVGPLHKYTPAKHHSVP
jgi:hypothetical protein